jgi:hypothetical protein
MKQAVFLLCQIALAKAFVVPRATVAEPSFSSLKAKKQSDEIPTEEVDVVVIGSGLAGLSCAALLSHCDKKTVVLEAHDTPGGAVRLEVTAGLVEKKYRVAVWFASAVTFLIPRSFSLFVFLHFFVRHLLAKQ